MANYTVWVVFWLSTLAIGILAANSTNTTESPTTSELTTTAVIPEPTTDNETPQSRPDLHLPLAPGTIAGLAIAGAVILLISVSCLIFFVCFCFYQVGTCCDCIVA